MNASPIRALPSTGADGRKRPQRAHQAAHPFDPLHDHLQRYYVSMTTAGLICWATAVQRSTSGASMLTTSE